MSLIKTDQVRGVVQWVKPWLRNDKYGYYAAVKITSLGARMVTCFVYFKDRHQHVTNPFPFAGDKVVLYRDGHRWKIAVIDYTDEFDTPTIVEGK